MAAAEGLDEVTPDGVSPLEENRGLMSAPRETPTFKGQTEKEDPTEDPDKQGSERQTQRGLWHKKISGEWECSGVVYLSGKSNKIKTEKHRSVCYHNKNWQRPASSKLFT